MIILGFIALLVAYLMGSIPTAVWIGKAFYGIDVREQGSGNAGATNTFRVLGKAAGIPVLLIDALKGWLAVMLPVWILGGFDSPVLFENFRVTCGAMAVIGHVFPVFAGFRGGKGVATLMGVAFGMFPLAALGGVALFLVVLLFTHYVSLGSILASIGYGLFLLLVEKVHHDATIIFAVMIPLLVILTHKANIQRLISGNESRTYLRKGRKHSV
jgi:acyl phosphate:glycerol-3-phosphate acyltransferase